MEKFTQISEQALYKAILKQSGHAIFVFTTNGLLMLFNDAAEKMLAYLAEELIAKQSIELFCLESEIKQRAKQFSEELGIAIKPGIDVITIRSKMGLSNQYEWTLVDKDGHQIPVMLSVSALYEKNEIIGYLALAVDISEQKQVEALVLASENKLKEAQRLAKMGSWTLDLVNNQLEWSDEIFKIFEIDQQQFDASYEAFLNAIHPDDRDKVNQAYNNSLVTQQAYEISHRLLLSDNRIKYVQEACETVFDEKGKPLLSRGTVQDVSSLKKTEQKLHLYANVFIHNPDAVLITNVDNEIIAVNPALQKLTGYEQQELIGKNPKVLASGKTKKEIYQQMWQDLNTIGHWQGELMDKKKDGSIYPKWISVAAIKNEDGEITNYIGTFTDISERKAAAEKIEHLAHHDTLTGLYNRFSLDAHLEQVMIQAKRNHKKLALVVMDMDKFKNINDSYGHHIGDEILIEVAKRLKSNLRESDIIARLGGDEFVVILPCLDSYIGAAEIVTKLLTKLAENYYINKYVLRLTPSIGIAMFPEDSEDKNILMKHADTAMYHAKDQGRNNYQFFTAKMNEAMLERHSLELDLRNAINNQEFELYYQPKYATKNMQIIGVEALIRWNHTQRGFVPPDKFIPVCEEIGLINAVGEWVFDESCRQLRLWNEQGIKIGMAINLSAKQLYDKSLIQQLETIINKYQINQQELELEITETAAMSDAEHAIKQLEAIRQLGIDLAIDDFGTGYSSLAYLKLFPIQILKLDRTFVRDIEQDKNDAMICQATISLAHSLGLKVVAEGVETKEQQQFLQRHDCDFLQGYLFSRPLPANEVTALIVKNHAEQ